MESKLLDCRSAKSSENTIQRQGKVVRTEINPYSHGVLACSTKTCEAKIEVHKFVASLGFLMRRPPQTNEMRSLEPALPKVTKGQRS